MARKVHDKRQKMWGMYMRPMNPSGACGEGGFIAGLVRNNAG